MLPITSVFHKSNKDSKYSCMSWRLKNIALSKIQGSKILLIPDIIGLVIVLICG